MGPDTETTDLYIKAADGGYEKIGTVLLSEEWRPARKKEPATVPPVYAYKTELCVCKQTYWETQGVLFKRVMRRWSDWQVFSYIPNWYEPIPQGIPPVKFDTEDVRTHYYEIGWDVVLGPPYSIKEFRVYVSLWTNEPIDPEEWKKRAMRMADECAANRHIGVSPSKE